MVIVNPETKGPLGDSHLGEVRANFAPWGSFPAAPWAFLCWGTVWSHDEKCIIAGVFQFWILFHSQV